MKRLAILFLLFVLLVDLVTPASHSASDAPRFVSLEGGFSISLPERYKQQTRLVVPIPCGDAYGSLYEWRIAVQVSIHRDLDKVVFEIVRLGSDLLLFSLSQTPEAPRAGSDASDEGLRGPIKNVRTENQHFPETRLSMVGTAILADYPGSGLRSHKKRDTRYNHKFEFKYDEKKRLIAHLGETHVQHSDFQ